MADPFVAEIRIFPFNFAPKGWACVTDNRYPCSENTALFLRPGRPTAVTEKQFRPAGSTGRAPMHPQQGPGLSPA